MNFSRFFQSVGAMFRPPFAGFAAVMWLYYAWCFFIHPDSPIMKGDFIDPDDPMALAQTIDWLRGQSWFDIHQYRMDPPDGIILPFSRFSEAPVGALIYVFHVFGLPWSGAGIIAAGIWPLVLLGFLFAALRWVALSFVPRDWAGFTAYVALFATTLMFQFTPGHIDHHGLAAMITLMAFGCTVRMMDEPEKLKWGAFAGFWLAFGQVIALEVLPWTLALSGWVCAWMTVQGRSTARTGLAFGGALYLASILFLVATQRPVTWFDADALQYSVTYVLIAGGIAVACGGIAFAAQFRQPLVRYAAAAILLLGAGALFLTKFPELVAGPYGAMDKDLASLFFDNIAEALPLTRREPSIVALLLRIALPLFGLIASFRILFRADGEQVWRWLLTALMLLAAILLATFYQVRYLYYAMMFAVVPVAAWFRYAHANINANWRGRRLVFGELGLLLLVGPLFNVLIPALIDSRPLNTGVMLFPVQFGDDKCGTFNLERILNARKLYGDRPRLIMNMMDLGPEILFRTRHMVLGGGYHMNVRGNLNSVRFFSTTDAKEAERIARERHVDLVVMCRQIPAMYLGKDGPNQIDVDSAKGTLEVKPTASFAEQLIYGKVPPWLERKNFATLDNYLLFEVKPEPQEKPKEQDGKKPPAPPASAKPL